jgi:ubiquinone/menaquinone biosynthesis C-methylase UbiE
MSLTPTDLEKEIRAWFDGTGADLFRELGLQPGHVAIDLGCGPGRFTVPLAQVVSPGGRVIAVDRSPDALKQLAERLDTWAPSCNVECLETDGPAALGDMEPHSLDAALIFDVLQHMKDWDALLTDLARALKPDGRIVVYPAAVPHPDSVDMSRFGQLAQTHGFRNAGDRTLRLPHAHSVVEDRVHLFQRVR